MEVQAALGLRPVMCQPPYEEVLLLRLLGHRLRQLPMGSSTGGIVDGQALIILKCCLKSLPSS
jgi:hypothetical protein